METISIHDAVDREKGAVLSFDLIDLLRLFEPRVLQSQWEATEVEAYPLASHGLEEWEPYAEGTHTLSGAELMRLAACTFQTVDGDFSGYQADRCECWIKIQAVDGRYFLVASDQPEVIGLLKSHYRDVRQENADQTGNP